MDGAFPRLVRCAFPRRNPEDAHLSYAVELLPEARRRLDRLPEKHLFAALEFIYGPLAEEPHRVGGPLRFER